MHILAALEDLDQSGNGSGANFAKCNASTNFSNLILAALEDLDQCRNGGGANFAKCYANMYFGEGFRYLEVLDQCGNGGGSGGANTTKCLDSIQSDLCIRIG